MKGAFCFERFLLSRHRHSYSTEGTVKNYIAYVINGSCRIVSSDKILEIKTGDVFYIPKNCKYKSFWQSNTTIEFISLGFSSLDVTDDLNFELQVINCDEDIKKRILGIETGGEGISIGTLADFCKIVALLKPYMTCKKQSRAEKVIERAERFVSENPTSGVSEIARACGVSEPYLYSIFKKEMHTTPNNFRQAALCRKGAELLKTTDASVEEISARLNFSSTSYFRKIMKKHTGKIPTEIRKTAIF